MLEFVSLYMSGDYDMNCVFTDSLRSGSGFGDLHLPVSPEVMSLEVKS